MRALIALFVVAGCASEPKIACTTDQQCPPGQTCGGGTCAAPMSSQLDASMRDGVVGPDAPTVCTPACTTGSYCTGTTCSTCNVDGHCGASCAACGLATPHCDGAACVQCVTALQCPVTTPCCVNHACQLLGC
jgi:hypothetical protein